MNSSQVQIREHDESQAKEISLFLFLVSVIRVS
jgi:hypothetical protein